MEFERGDFEQCEMFPWRWGENLDLFIEAERELKSYFNSNLDLANLISKKIDDGVASVWIIGGVANPNKFIDREEDDIDILIEVSREDTLYGINQKIGEGEIVHLLAGELKRDKWRVEITNIFMTWLQSDNGFHRTNLVSI